MHKQRGLIVSICLLLIALAGGIGYVAGRGPFVMARQVQHILQSEALTPPDTLTMDQAACAALAQAVQDEYTQWLSPVQMQALLADIEGEAAAGIGAEMVTTKEGWRITEVADQSPAQKAGLIRGDLVVKVNGASALNGHWTPEEGVTTLLTVSRDGMERDVVVIPQIIEPLCPLVVKTLPGEYGYIRIRSFVQQDVELLFDEAMEQLAGTKGVVIDVRHNPGGRMDAVLAMLDGFLPEDTELLCLHQAQGESVRYLSEGGQKYTMPVAVLTDGQSASAAEIFAGVLQNQKRASIVGDVSYGKGVVQKMRSLKDGSGLKYTMAEYRLPDGTVIHEKGVTPDVLLSCQGLPGWAGSELDDEPLQAALGQLQKAVK